jgi:hypothetical protein
MTAVSSNKIAGLRGTSFITHTQARPGKFLVKVLEGAIREGGFMNSAGARWAGQSLLLP